MWRPGLGGGWRCGGGGGCWAGGGGGGVLGMGFWRGDVGWGGGGARRVVGVGGGPGIYSIALLQRHEGLRAVVFDRAEVLKVAGEMRDAYGVGDRLELVAGDMFTDPLPGGCDLVLLS